LKPNPTREEAQQCLKENKRENEERNGRGRGKRRRLSPIAIVAGGTRITSFERL
jgi:hypothetical protein